MNRRGWFLSTLVPPLITSVCGGAFAGAGPAHATGAAGHNFRLQPRPFATLAPKSRLIDPADLNQRRRIHASQGVHLP